MGVLAVLCALAVHGCSRSNSVKPGNVKVNPQNDDVLKPAIDLMRQATGIPQYRDALLLLNRHLEKTDVKKPAALTKEERALLDRSFALDPDEMEEVESPTFRTASDAYHLDSAFLFRDAARFLEATGSTPLEQAKTCFEWVMRRIRLFDQSDEWLPPAQVLRRGFGNHRDRALVFIELMRQFQVEGCVIAAEYPKEWHSPLLVGLLLTEADKQEIFLFDPRLGTPIAAAKAQVPKEKEDGRRAEKSGVATLAQANANHELLTASGFPADAAQKLQVFLAPPLAALAPRMRYLEGVLSAMDQISLHQDFAKTWRSFELHGPVAVWNERGEPKAPPPSPVRALRLILPADDGGIDKTGRIQRYLLNQFPLGSIVGHYNDMKIYRELSDQPRTMLLQKTMELFGVFYIQPEEHLLRGQFTEALKRLERIRTVAEMEEAAHQPDNAAVQKRIAEWRERVRGAYLELARKESGAQAKVNQLWNEDQYLLHLFQVDSEIPLAKFEKKTLSFILLHACREALGQQVAELEAARWHEKAAHAQALADALAAQGKDNDRFQREAKSGWVNARGSWSKYLDRYPLNAVAVSRRLEAIHRKWIADEYEGAVALWELLHADMHALLDARLRLAESQTRLGSEALAQSTYNTLLDDIAQLKKSDIQKGLAASQEGTGDRVHAARLELLARSWAPQGHLAWLEREVRARIK